NGIPFMLIFTKADKQSRVKSDQNVAKFRKRLSTWFEEIPQTFITSSETNLGCDEVLSVIAEINQGFEKPNLIDRPTFALKDPDSKDLDSHYDSTKSYDISFDPPSVANSEDPDQEGLV